MDIYIYIYLYKYIYMNTCIYTSLSLSLSLSLALSLCSTPATCIPTAAPERASITLHDLPQEEHVWGAHPMHGCEGGAHHTCEGGAHVLCMVAAPHTGVPR